MSKTNDKNMANNTHIGELIKQKFEKRGCTVSWFAQKLSCDRSNIYDIFKRESIDTKRLYKISETLEFNFFKVLSDDFENRDTNSVE